MEQKANQALKYEEFEPLCKWQRKEDRDILEIHLQEFKKEQLKVQISNYGILKISGERPLDSSIRTKFYKEVPVPAHKYDTSAINAKFLNGCLYITMPKTKPQIHDSSKIDQSPIPDFTANHSNGGAPPPQNIAGGPKEEGLATSGGNAPTECEFRSRERRTSALGLAKVAVSLAATAVVVAVLVAYVVYMFKSTVDECY